MRPLTSLTCFLFTAAATLATGSAALAQTCPADDGFEDNDDCASPTTLTAGTYSDLALHGQANAGGVDLDYFEISVPNGQQLTIDALFATANGDIDLFLYEGANCATLTSIGGTATDDETVSATNNSGSTLTYSLEADAWGSTFDCNDYDLVVSLAADPCAVLVADSYEDNDDCASAQALPAGGDTGLNVENGDEDYYTITTQSGFQTVIDVGFVHATGDIDAELFQDLACTNQVDISQTVSDDETVSYLNTSGGPIDVVLHVYGYGPGFGCNDYDVTVTSMADPCAVLAEDSLEENDACSSAAVVTEGNHPSLAVFETDPDWYEVALTDGEMLTASIAFTHDDGDLDLALWDSCGGTQLAISQSVDDDEQVTWTNDTGAATTVYLETYVWTGSTIACNSYDLDVQLDGGLAVMPTCPGDGSTAPCPCGNDSTVAEEGCENSQGHGAILTASGSSSVAADDLAFTVSQARPSQPSLLVQGATLIGVPFKDGVLCTGTPTERVEVVFLDGGGAGTTSGSIVTNGNVSAGDTRYYQQWYRDPTLSPCGTGSNFSGGLVVVYGP